MKDDRSINDRANRAAHRCHNRKTSTTPSTSQRHVATSQPQTHSTDDTHNPDTRVHDLRSERYTPLSQDYREQDDHKTPSPTQLLKYVDDRDSTIIHFGVIGTHEGKTLIPKNLVHRNALDDLAHPYDEDGDVYVLDVNLDGDQIDCLLQYSEIYDAGGEFRKVPVKRCRVLTLLTYA